MRNPFRIRASQRAVNDEQFVRMFAAGALDLIRDADEPWTGLVFLTSAPGGGKSTFLRLLTPKPLTVASRLGDDPNTKPTHDALRKVGAIGTAGPDLVGVMVTFTNEYKDVEEIDRGHGAFRALLSARIVLATLRAVLDRCERSFPEDLADIQFRWTGDGSSIPSEADGRQLYDWASSIERSFYEVLDELGHTSSGAAPKHTSLEALRWFATTEIKMPSGLLTARRVLLLDDLQFLADGQRKMVRETLTSARLGCGIWVAERLEALADDDLLAEGALEDRDYDGQIHLEARWRRRGPAFSRFVGQIAELRARKADGFEGRDFFAALAEGLDPAVWDPRFEEACAAIRERLQKRTGGSERYSEWMAQAEAGTASIRDRALAWRMTEIIVERDLGRTQSAFDFEPLSEAELKAKESSGAREAAELFLLKETSAPYYFGRTVLSALSSSNVDQFVELAGDLFEEIAAKAVGRRGDTAPLAAERQHAILKKAAKRRWEGIPRRVPRGFEARLFLDAVGAFCAQQTYRRTAPYAPGVTGIAITMEERERLINAKRDDPLGVLRGMLASLVAQNLLEPRLDHKNKGKRHLVLYLNRLMCAHFDLPLGYGGWREKPLKELLNWSTAGPKAVKNGDLI
jgi:hypothetical protein